MVHLRGFSGCSDVGLETVADVIVVSEREVGKWASVRGSLIHIVVRGTFPGGLTSFLEWTNRWRAAYLAPWRLILTLIRDGALAVGTGI